MTPSLRTNSIRLSLAGLALLGALACTQSDSASTSDLERDLEQTKMAEMEMANRGGARTDVVSSVERISTGEKRPVAVAPAPKTSTEKAPVPDPVVAEVAGLPAPRPRAPEPPKPTRKGPYKSTSEVIRNAPFPINP